MREWMVNTSVADSFNRKIPLGVGALTIFPKQIKEETKMIVAPKSLLK